MGIHEDRWEKIYQEHRYETRYPFTEVVSFIFRHAPQGVPREEVKVLEIGCGLGNNLGFIADEGFDVTGLDISETAIARAKRIFESKGQKVKLVCESCAATSFQSGQFDLIIDRSCLTVLPDPVFQQTVTEISRIIKTKGRLLFSCFADSHSANKIDFPLIDGLVEDIGEGHLAARRRGLRFVSLNEVRQIFSENWNFISLRRSESANMLDNSEYPLEASWLAVLEKCGKMEKKK